MNLEMMNGKRDVTCAGISATTMILLKRQAPQVLNKKGEFAIKMMRENKC